MIDRSSVVTAARIHFNIGRCQKSDRTTFPTHSTKKSGSLRVLLMNHFSILTNSYIWHDDLNPFFCVICQMSGCKCRKLGREIRPRRLNCAAKKSRKRLDIFQLLHQNCTSFTQNYPTFWNPKPLQPRLLLLTGPSKYFCMVLEVATRCFKKI